MTFIYDKQGNKYEFNKLSLKETLQYQAQLASTTDDLAKTIDIEIAILEKTLRKSYPDYAGNFEEDVIEYNFEVLGMQGFASLLSAIFEEVFQLRGANTTPRTMYPFLQEEKK